MTRLLADFYQFMGAADLQNMHDHESKRWVRYLLLAFRLLCFKTYVEVQLKREKNEYLKKDWREFVEWLIERFERYTEFESIAGTGVPRSDKRNGRSAGVSERSLKKR